MATYDRLSVSAGGGILNDMKKSDRQDDATLCIGLGGTGKDALKKFEKVEVPVSIRYVRSAGYILEEAP